MSFLNETPERRQWLDFTSPIFSDPNVLITHEEHSYIADLGAQVGKTVALPRGTMVAERLRREFPNLAIVETDNEQDAVWLVSERQAHMTVRSLIIAAYTIRKQGLFNLKIAGQMPEYANQLRIGVRKEHPLLRDILEKGVRSISAQEREQISGRHVAIKVLTSTDHILVWGVIATAMLVLIAMLYWVRKSREMDLQRVQLSEQRVYLSEQRAHLSEQRVQEELRARQEQSRLVAMLSHEVRTPLAMIDGAVQSLEMMLPVNEELARLRMQRIRLGVQRIVGLTEQFLAKDRLEDPALKPRLQTLRLHAVVLDMVQQLDAEHRFRISVAGNDVIQVDQELLQVALRNLMKNALLYSVPDSSIDIEVDTQTERVQLRIRNHAQEGIRVTEHATLFERYTRGSNHQGRPGSGLGLYLVKRVIALHGGKIRLSTNAGGVVEFTLTLPRDGGVRRA